VNNKIVTNNSVIEYEEKVFPNEKAYLNIENATINLIEAKEILDNHNIGFGLIYGTLLGAIREKGFILHDRDTDLFVLDEEKEALLDVLPDFLSAGFNIGRYDGELLSLVRSEEYIDFYFFRKSGLIFRKCTVGLKAKAKYLENTMSYSFLGENFQVPIESEKLLVDLYGKNWMVPVKDVAAIEYNKYIIFRNYVRTHFPSIYKVLNKL
jgi:lipopolysaccharide cholinephosphotransferase